VACSGALGAPCSATAAVVASFCVVSALVFIVLLVLSAVDPRMTIHHSFSTGKQELSSVFLRRWIQVSSRAEQHRVQHETQPAMGGPA
jgi:hypothetical protein